MKPIYCAVKMISGWAVGGHPTLPKKANGEDCQTEEEGLSRWAEHYEETLNHAPAEVSLDLNDLALNGCDDPFTNVDAPALNEIIVVIKKLRNPQAPGEDKIPPELLKYAPVAIRTALHTTSFPAGVDNWEDTCRMERWNNWVTIQG